MSWYVVLGDAANCDCLEVLIRATDCDAACLAARMEHGLEVIWSVVPTLRRGR